ncbi:hypothetical protein ACKFKH_29815 [Phormidesmis sp. 146-20]
MGVENGKPVLSFATVRCILRTLKALYGSRLGITLTDNIKMRRQLVPDLVFIELQGTEPPVHKVATSVDLRTSRIDEFFNARSLTPNSQKAYRSNLKHFLVLELMRLRYGT